MAKIQRIDPTKSATSAPPVADLPNEPKTLRFDLARNRGEAIFREPTAADLAKVEGAIGKLGGAMNEAKMFEFCRKLARLCCVEWGTESTMPEPDRIRVSDDNSAIALFAQQLHLAQQDVEGFCTLLEGESSRGDGFDAYQVELRDGVYLVFDEPTQLDNQRKEKGKTATDGTLQFAAALCRVWEGEAMQWSEALVRLRSLSLEDFFRVSLSLTFFRG